MLKAFLRLCAGVALCALLVYAPELYMAAQSPYVVSVSERVLLRISLCSSHPAAAEAFYKMLSIYMKEHPSHHIRVTRADADTLFSSSDYPPDLYVFPEHLPYDSSKFLSMAESAASCQPIVCASEETLLCGVTASTPYRQQALALLSDLAEKPAHISSP